MNLNPISFFVLERTQAPLSSQMLSIDISMHQPFLPPTSIPLTFITVSLFPHCPLPVLLLRSVPHSLPYTPQTAP
jgi:hypothetical protein